MQRERSPAQRSCSPDPPLGFVHPLVRDAVYLELPPGERELQHARAAAAAARAAVPPEQIAAHILAAPGVEGPWVVDDFARRRGCGSLARRRRERDSLSRARPRGAARARRPRQPSSRPRSRRGSAPRRERVDPPRAGLRGAHRPARARGGGDAPCLDADCSPAARRRANDSPLVRRPRRPADPPDLRHGLEALDLFTVLLRRRRPQPISRGSIDYRDMHRSIRPGRRCWPPAARSTGRTSAGRGTNALHLRGERSTVPELYRVRPGHVLVRRFARPGLRGGARRAQQLGPRTSRRSIAAARCSRR